MCQAIKEKREKVRKFIENKSFDLFIMSLICLDAIIFGMMTSDKFNDYFGNVLFILDRMCMAIFIIEMVLKLFVYKTSFFTSKWNTFDFIIITVSSFSFANYLIVLRTFRLFRILKYINRFSQLRKILNVLNALLPNFIAVLLVFAVFLYVFAIVAVSLFGNVFIEFATLGGALFALLQIFTLDGWASDIANPVMSVFPNAWIFFVSFLLFSFLLIVSFIMSVIDEIFRRDILSSMPIDCKMPELEVKKAPTLPKKKSAPRRLNRAKPIKAEK